MQHAIISYLSSSHPSLPLNCRELIEKEVFKGIHKRKHNRVCLRQCQVRQDDWEYILSVIVDLLFDVISALASCLLRESLSVPSRRIPSSQCHKGFCLWLIKCCKKRRGVCGIHYVLTMNLFGGADGIVC